MISPTERMRLVRQYRNEPACVTAVMLRAMGGLLLVVILAVIGIQTRSPDEADGRDARYKFHERESVSHARQLYDERRANIQDRQTSSTASGATSLMRVEEPRTVLPAGGVQQ